ncbi:MAG: NADH-quinone oxidoreductase subunit C [Actinomycetes bacterium]
MNVSVEEWRTSAAAARADGGAWFAMLTAVDDPVAGVIDVVLVVGEPGTQQKQLRCAVDRTTPVLDSVADLWSGAAFAEREVHEMFGVDFAGNADLRPLLLPAGVEAPLRRDAGLGRRSATEWPGAVEPSDSAKVRRRPIVAIGADSENWAVEL